MKRIQVIRERCTGCMSCVVACQKSHADSDFYSQVRDVEPMRIYLQAFDAAPVPVVCEHCDDPLCVKGCITGAMRKDPESGIVSNEFESDKCVGCWMCVMLCPHGVISARRNEEKKVAVKCDLCMKLRKDPAHPLPACVESCPTDALLFMEDEEFAGLVANGIHAPRHAL